MKQKKGQGKNSEVHNLPKIMSKVQQSRSTFEKYSKVLKDIYNKVNFEEFYEEFATILLNLFTTDKTFKSVYVQRSLEFMSKFAASLYENNEADILFPKLIRDILQFHNVKNIDVRFHICKFINMLLNELGEASLDDNLLDEISFALQDRINDHNTGVRLQAVLASQRLQDPSNKDDPIINSYFKTLITETSPFIRKAILEIMAVNSKTITVIVQRCLDSNDSVRYAVYQRLSKISVRLLKLEQRQFVLRNGLTLEPKIVELISNSLLPKWLSKYDKNLLDFCKALKLDATEDEFKKTMELLENVLPLLFKQIPANELKDVLKLNNILIPEMLTFESSVYWRCLIKYLKVNFDDEACVEAVMPELMDLIEFTQNFYTKIKMIPSEWEVLNETQILNQLLKIILFYDIVDNAQTQRVRNFVTDLLTDAFLNYDSVLLLNEIFKKIEPNTEKRSQEIVMIVNNIHDPLVATTETVSENDIQKRNLRIAPLRVKLNEMREEMDEAIIRQEFKEADRLKNEISSIETQIKDIQKEYEPKEVQVAQTKNDLKTISKCMDVLIAFFISSKITELNPTLISIMENFVKENLATVFEMNSDFKVLQCYGLMCLWHKKEAFAAIQIFCQQLLMYHYHLVYNQIGLVKSAGIVTDLLLLYGASIFGDEEYQEINATRRSKKSLYDNAMANESLEEVAKATLQIVIETFSDMLDDSNPELRELGGDCLMKLLYYNVIKAPGILSKLIVKWFNPATEKDLKLRQLLGVFFSLYVSQVPGSLTVIEKAFLPTLNVIINAPNTSPLKDIDIDSVIKFLVDITRLLENKDDIDVHKSLAIKLCSEIISRSHNTNNNNLIAIYIRTLLYLDVPYADLIVVEELKTQSKKILSLLDDKTQKPLKKHIEKYLSKLNYVDIDSISGNRTENLSVNMSNLSMESRNKRKRDTNDDDDVENDENQPDSDEMLIESVSSDEDVSPIENDVEREPSPPRRILRKSARLRN